MDEEKLVAERLKSLTKFAKEKYLWISYLLLGLIVYIAAWVRTRGLSGLRDITTGGWTLGPDLDPFLFLRWARYIVEHGTLMSIDMMRNFPLGADTSADFVTHSYFIAWFHKLALFFGSVSVEQSAALYPVFIFCLGIIFLFLFVKKVFSDSLGDFSASIIGLLSAFFTSIVPVLIPRTVAGIPDKQGTFVLFLFLSLYLFICAWKAKSTHNQIILSVIAGLANGLFYIVWGGGWLASIIIAPAVLLSFFFGNLNKNKIYSFLIWLVIPPMFLFYFSTRFSILTLLSSFFTGFPIFVGLFLVFHYFVYESYLDKKISIWPKIPSLFKSAMLITVIGLIFAFILFGPTYVWNMLTRILGLLISPAPTDRFNLTVAQNRIPYLSEITSSFGPYLGGFPIFFTIFILSSIYLVYKTVEVLGKKERWYLSLSYAAMLFAILMSRYSANSTFNGESFSSHILYGLGVLIFLATSIYSIWTIYRENRKEVLKEIDFGYVLILILFFLTLISVKGAIRLVLLLVPSAAIVAAYFVVSLFIKINETPNESLKYFKIILGILVTFLLIYSANNFFNQSAQTSRAYVPSMYTNQWQYAMDWVRHNTPENAVFGHWWDYGYWVQSIGNRSTVLDGGNIIVYWNHLMGRYALTGTDNQLALDFLYSHNTTHFLIDSTDIGKYAAYAGIGSDQKYDRYAFIPTMVIDTTQTQERKNSTFYIYRGGSALDEDIRYNDNGTIIFIPAANSGLGGIMVERQKNNNSQVSQVSGVFFYQNKQFIIPLRYAYIDNTLIDFGKGLDAGVFLMPGILAQGQQFSIQKDYALLYLSSRTVHSQLARLYLFKENNTNFQLVHSEDDLVIAMLKSQKYLDANIDIVLDQTQYANARGNNLAGPIKIWSINYPAGMAVNQTHLLGNYPDQTLVQSR